jgi:hypothetical protein
MLQKTTNKNVDLPTNKHVVLLLLFLKPKIIPQEKLQGKGYGPKMRSLWTRKFGHL